jgi:cupin domain
MAYTVLPAADAFWRASNQMGVQNTDLAKQLEASTLGARLWRLAPGQASTRHRHLIQHELYVLLEGTGRMRVDGELLTLEPFPPFSSSPRACVRSSTTPTSTRSGSSSARRLRAPTPSR